MPLAEEEDVNELLDRRRAEIEVISAAFASEEAWVELSAIDSAPRIYRRFIAKEEEQCACFLVKLALPDEYPDCSLIVESVQVETGATLSRFLKAAHSAAASLRQLMQQAALVAIGGEAIFSVFSVAQDWLDDHWLSHFTHKSHTWTETANSANTLYSKATAPCNQLILERRFIYSHHIISKTKRSDIIDLARSQLRLTGCMKIGWPGILFIEGSTIDCQAFYDIIRRWQWQYLVERGREQETVECDKTELKARRRFKDFTQVDDMSLLAEACRNVGLDSLFRSCLNLTVADDQQSIEVHEPLYGALIHVDHMNDAKTYRKWLRNACEQRDVALLIKNCCTTNGRLIIFVALVGHKSNLIGVLKRWRTTKVDVDSRNRPCFERMMTVLVEGSLPPRRSLDRLDWERTNSDAQLRLKSAEALAIVESIGGQVWRERLRSILGA
ncbi:RWD domain-containing protein 2B [Mayamaea pseudoterrestris]|nr:RWD domain-containing protein 2B [Mayamaea pseudoterrestris]